MISKDLEDSYLDIADKFFPGWPYSEGGILERYLDAPQLYSGDDTITIAYSWCTILAERTVRKGCRLPKPENRCKQRQGRHGLSAGPLYGDEVSR
jgi:hypothetical protein